MGNETFYGDGLIELREIVFSTSHILQQQCSRVPVLNQSSFTLYAIPD